MRNTRCSYPHGQNPHRDEAGVAFQIVIDALYNTFNEENTVSNMNGILIIEIPVFSTRTTSYLEHLNDSIKGFSVSIPRPHQLVLDIPHRHHLCPDIPTAVILVQPQIIAVAQGKHICRTFLPGISLNFFLILLEIINLVITQRIRN